jgi:hypothetical protein
MSGISFVTYIQSSKDWEAKEFKVFQSKAG